MYVVIRFEENEVGNFLSELISEFPVSDFTSSKGCIALLWHLHLPTLWDLNVNPRLRVQSSRNSGRENSGR